MPTPTTPTLGEMCAAWPTVTDAQYADLQNGRTTLAQIITENVDRSEDFDLVVDLASGVAIPLSSARIVRNFSRELHAEDPEAVAFYAEAHGQVIA